MAQLALMHDSDDVVVALVDVVAGQWAATADGWTVVVADDVPAGHKIARRALRAGALVHKYGQVIGQTSVPVAEGAHVHTHNLAMPARDTRVLADTHPGIVPSGSHRRTFQGIRRPDGRVATRTYIGVLTTVNCSATVAAHVARHFDLVDLPGVDGVVALPHESGCGLESSGDGWEILRRTIRGYARHPNMAGLVVVGLGCEVLTMDTVLADLGVTDIPVVPYTIQSVGGTRKAIAEGIRIVTGLAARVGDVTRTTCGLQDLVCGLKCGGSDAWSGVSANPALGYASDLIVAAGGTTILAEMPEIYGAEHLLAARATSPEVAADLMARIDWWERYTAANGASLDANPSAGNKAGGITTIVEKSLGAVTKAGTAPVRAVVDYAAPVPHGGLVVMDTPGYDPVAVTGLIAGGANVVVFTTGRGSVFGSKPVPTIKASSNSALAARMPDDIDIDCGTILTGQASVAEVGEAMLDLICAVASGEPTRSEELGVGHEELVPWRIGAVM